jgi:hypothetical protein
VELREDVFNVVAGFGTAFSILNSTAKNQAWCAPVFRNLFSPNARHDLSVTYGDTPQLFISRRGVRNHIQQ